MSNFNNNKIMEKIFNVELHITCLNGIVTFRSFPCLSFEAALRVINRIINKEKEGNICPNQCHAIDCLNGNEDFPIIIQEMGNTIAFYIYEEYVITADDNIEQIDYEY